jgi:hypothetical protein
MGGTYNTHMGEMRNDATFESGDQKGKYHFGDLA